MKDVNILMVGVGGQGVILASDAMSEVAVNAGYDVKKTDSLGMAQRGGSVVSNVRLGEKVFSPLIKKGEVDFLIGFEEIEAARWASYLSPDGVAIVADVQLIPLSAMSGAVPYPQWDEIQKGLARYARNIYLLPATKIGEEVKNPKALNIVLMGALSAFLDVDQEIWLTNLKRSVPPKFLDSSLQAFAKGVSEMKAIKQN